jgi:hypothetical protein
MGREVEACNFRKTRLLSMAVDNFDRTRTGSDLCAQGLDGY